MKDFRPTLNSGAKDFDLRLLPRRLSDGETQVMVRLIDGKSCRQIAKELGNSPCTIRTHVQRAIKKIGAKSMLHAAVIFAISVR